MHILRSRFMTYFVYLTFIVCISMLLVYLWLENSSARKVFVDPLLLNFHKHPKVVQRKPSTENIKFDCRKLFDNDTDEILRTKSYLQSHRYIFTHRSDQEFSKMTMNCDAFKESHKYIHRPSPSSDIETKFPVAFNILFHQNVEQFERLLQTIYRPQHQFCIHVDAKTSDDVLESVRSIANCFDNVFIASTLEIIVYAGYTRLLADINCMRDHVERKFEWKYLINMAASEFPILSNLQMVQMLNYFNGSNNMRETFHGLDADRFQRKHVTYTDMRNKTGHVIHTNEVKDSPPHDLTITKGNAYNVFSRQFVEFVLEDEIALELLAWSADTLTPDEHYWATLNNLYSNPFLNTPGGFKGHPDKKPFIARYIGWKNKKQHPSRCKASHFVHNVCIFSVEDLPVLASRGELIANKFDIDYDPVAYTCMEEWIRNKTRDKVEIKNGNMYKKIAGIT